MKFFYMSTNPQGDNMAPPKSPKSAFLWKGSYRKPKNTKMTALATLINKF